METDAHYLKTALNSLGLSEKEAVVYLALLELGRSTVSKIARKAGVNRATAYVILDSLTGKGLITMSGKEPKQEYSPESPERLIELCKAKRDEADSRIIHAERIVAQLKPMYQVGDRPRVRFYEGRDGLKQVYEDTLTASGEILAFGSYEVEEMDLGPYFSSYYRRRAAKNIPVRGIAPKTPLAEKRAALGTAEKRDLTLVPKRFGPKPELDIYDNKVMIASWREKLGIIIESAEIADAMKKIFELAWIGAKQVEKEAK